MERNQIYTSLLKIQLQNIMDYIGILIKLLQKKNDIPNKETRMYAKYRHIEKTKLCKEKNIRLIHIFEDDQIYRKDIVKDILKQSLGIYDRKIPASKCEVKEISLKEYKNFLEEKSSTRGILLQMLDQDYFMRMNW